MDSELRVHLSEEGADAERLEMMTGFLRDELVQLDVEDVTVLRAGDPPPGTRAFDVVAVGGLLVSLGQSAGLVAEVVSTIRRWLGAGGGTRRTVRLEIGNDVLELSEATAADQQRLIDVFVRRHAKEDMEP
jgi:hypothetical protein